MAKLFEVRVLVNVTEVHEVLATDEEDALEKLSGTYREPLLSYREDVQSIEATYVADVPSDYFDIDTSEDDY